MALMVSSVSQICKSLAQYLGSELGGGDSAVRVLLGSPADAVPVESDSDHRLNLFFFRFEPSGFGAETLPGETQLLRMHCLATPFAVLEDSISSGENDLRIIGEVLRIFHEKPVFQMTAGGESFHIQVIFQTLGLDQLNQLWSTQGEAVYRPSVMFEVSLAPVIPSDAHVPGPMTGALGLEVRGTLSPGDVSAAAATPVVRTATPAIDREDWAPALALVYGGGLVQSLSFEVGSGELAAFVPQAWVAGQPGADVNLVWERWDSGNGWSTEPGGMAVTIAESTLDPDAISGATTTALSLPFDDQAGQLVLCAERSYDRAVDGHKLTVRSNPVLINLFEAGS